MKTGRVRAHFTIVVMSDSTHGASFLTCRSSTSNWKLAPGGISPCPMSSYPTSGGTVIVRRPPARMPASASGMKITGGGFGPLAPMKSPPPPSMFILRVFGST